MFTATGHIERAFESSEAALAPLRERLPWGDPFRGTVAVPESELIYRAGRGRLQILYPIFIYIAQMAGGWRVRYEFERLPERHYAWPVIWLSLGLAAGLQAGWPGLIAAGLFCGSVVAFVLGRALRRSHEIDRALQVMYGMPRIAEAGVVGADSR